MDDDQFWAIIERTREFAEGRDERLAAELGKLSPKEIRAFDARFTDYRIRAYRWDIWGVADWIHGWCSDDGFSDFRARLIGLGKERYFAALEDPDTLAEIVGTKEGDYTILEGFQYVASDVFEEKTGKRMPAYYPPDGYPDLPDKNFDHNDVEAMRQKFPRLLQRLPHKGGVDPATVHIPERKLEYLGDWDDERVLAAVANLLGQPLRGDDPMISSQVSVTIDGETAVVEYTPILGIFAKGAPRVVDRIVARVR
jgi:hypothetical protein